MTRPTPLRDGSSPVPTPRSRRLCSSLGGGIAAGMFVAMAGAEGQTPTPPRPPVPGAPPSVTAFVDVAVIPMDTERVLSNQTVLVEHGRITALGPSKKVRVPGGARRIDTRGKYLMPGLADMHVHLESTTDVDPEVVLIGFLMDGVTTVRNMDHDDRARAGRVLQLKAKAAAGTMLIPRIYTSGPWYPYYPPDSGRGEPLFKVPMGEIPQHLAAYKAAGYDFVKVYSYYTRYFDSLVVAARQIGLPIMGHIPRQVSVERALAGMKSIEHMEGYLKIRNSNGTVTDRGTGVEPWPLDDARLHAIAVATREAGVWNCPTLFAMEKDARYREDGPRLIKALQEAGAGLLLGTDHAMFKEAHPIHRELQALVKAGLTPYQALVAGTRNPASLFGMTDEVGTIAVGKRADLVLLAGNPLTDIQNASQPPGVMIGGRWLAREDFDRQLIAVIPTKRYTTNAYMSLLETLGDVGLTEGQRTAFRQLLEAHTARRKALLDSLGSNANDLAVRQRVVRIVAEQLGEFRAGLTAPQQQQFDPRAREWVHQREADGYSVLIPGVR